MNLWVNMLFEWLNHEAEVHIERVLWIDPSGTDVVTIEIENSFALPIWHKCFEIEAAIVENQVRLITLDPYGKLLRPETEIPEEHRKRRDKAWSIIAPIVESKDGAAFSDCNRGQLVTDAAKRTGSIKKTIYNYLRRYWLWSWITLPNRRNYRGHLSGKFLRPKPHYWSASNLFCR